MEARPEIFDDFNEQNYREGITFESAMREVEQIDHSGVLLRRHLVNQLQRGTYLDEKDDTD